VVRLLELLIITSDPSVLFLSRGGSEKKSKKAISLCKLREGR
jgi:hypothetical protein